jgi:hypothetical protein
MRESYHNPPAAQVKTYAPGRPIKGCLEPNATDALRRAAEVHAAMPQPLQFKRRTAQPSQPQQAGKAVAA